MSPLQIVLVVVLILLLIGALPVIGVHSYGYYPAGGLGLILLIVLILILMGKL